MNSNENENQKLMSYISRTICGIQDQNVALDYRNIDPIYLALYWRYIKEDDLAKRLKSQIKTEYSKLSSKNKSVSKVVFLANRLDLCSEKEILEYIGKCNIFNRPLTEIKTNINNYIFDLMILIDFANKTGRGDFKERIIEDEYKIIGILLYTLQSYLLIEGALLIECCINLGIVNDFIDNSIEFLLFQQRNDGGFGYINPLKKVLTLKEKEEIIFENTTYILNTLLKFITFHKLPNK